MAKQEKPAQPEGPEGQTEDKLVFLPQQKRDSAKLELRFGENNLEARADLYPAVGKGAMLSVDFLEETLRKLGIVEGVDWEGIREALLRCNLDHMPVTDLLLARGRAPVPEKPEHIVLYDRFKEPARFAADDKSSIDFRALSPFITVRRGELVGKVEPRVEGRSGIDIMGKEIPAGKAQVTSYELGAKVKRVGQDIVSDTDGQILHEKGSIRVEEVLNIKGVDYKTGDIQFPGDVYIEGQISDDFKVMSGGSIFCKGTLDAFEVQCRKDLVVGGGIIGRAPAHVRVGGNLGAKFAQNARVAVRGDARVTGAIFSCSFLVLGKLDMGDKGRIIGGEVCAAKGIVCCDIGTAALPRTTVRCGIDFIARQKLERSNAKLQELAVSLTRVEQLLNRKPGPKLEAMHAGIKQAMMEQSEEIGRLMGEVEVDDSATVEARGTVYPHSTIEICNIAHEVTQEAKKVRFRLDKTAGRIVEEKL